jgi:hypothetical protein
MVTGQTQHQRGGYSQNHYRTTIDTSNVKEEVKSVVVKQIDTLSYLFDKYEALNKQHSTLKRNVTLFKEQNIKGMNQMIYGSILTAVSTVWLSVPTENKNQLAFKYMIGLGGLGLNISGAINIYQSFRKL